MLAERNDIVLGLVLVLVLAVLFGHMIGTGLTATNLPDRERTNSHANKATILEFDPNTTFSEG